MGILWLKIPHIYSDFLNVLLTEYCTFNDWDRYVVVILIYLLHTSLTILKSFQNLLLPWRHSGSWRDSWPLLFSLPFVYCVCLSALVAAWSHPPCQKVFHGYKRGTGARWPLTCWPLSLNVFPWQPYAWGRAGQQPCYFHQPCPMWLAPGKSAI